MEDEMAGNDQTRQEDANRTLHEINLRLTLQTSEMEAIRGHIERVERDVTVIKHKVIGGGEERPLQIRVEDTEREVKLLKDREEGQRIDQRAATAEVMKWAMAIVASGIIGAIVMFFVNKITG